MSNPPIKITFLGTGTSSGVPMIGCNCSVCTSPNKKDNRLRTSILVESATTSILVDCGPDFRYQMLREGIKKIDAILVTHPHKDHIGGLDDIRAFNFFLKKPIDIYCNAFTEEAIRRDYFYAFSDTKYPGLPELVLHSIPHEPFTVGDIAVTPILVWHYKMPVLGYRFGDFTYITDANRIESTEMQKIMGSSFLVLNALRKEPHLSHFNLEEAISVATQVGAKETYFTHLSHQMGEHDVVEDELPAGMHLAYDKLKLFIK